jgi:hypothetical protein
VAKRKRSQLRRQPDEQPRRQPVPAEIKFALGRSLAGMKELPARMEDYRRRLEQGDADAGLRALEEWLHCCSGPPKWLANYVCAALAKWIEGEVSTLDAAFGVQPRKHLDSVRLRRKHRAYILLRAEDLSRDHMPIDIRMFETIGAEIGQSGGFVKEVLYDEVSSRWRKILPKLPIRRIQQK